MKKIALSTLILILTGCSSIPPKVEISQDNKKTIKRIGLVEIPNQEKFLNNLGKSYASAPLYMFGAIGGVIAGGIEINRMNTAQEKFTNVLTPYKLKLNADLLENLNIGLTKKGYDVIRIPALTLTQDKKSPDYSKITENVDAVLHASVTASYHPNKGSYEPYVYGTGKLVNKDGSKTLYQKTFLYGNLNAKDIEIIPVNNKFILSNYDSVLINHSIAAEAFNIGTKEVSEKILQDF